MDPLDWIEPEELLQFFHCNKTEMSCMENPHTFLCQLRDHNLIPEDQYKKVSRMKSKINIKKSLYDILDWFEENQSEHITLFWSCVFKEIIINEYPTIRLLRNSLMDGSFHFSTQLPKKLENGGADKRKRKKLSEEEEDEDEEEEEEEEQVTSTKKKRKQKSKSVCEDEELQPGPSSQLTPGQKTKSKKICFSSPLKRGEQSDPWNWPLYKSQLPVTCGRKEGSLSRSRLAKGEKCILFEKQWFTPGQFEKHAGKGSSKNWKLSIQCMGTTLGKLIKEGHLKSTSYKLQYKKAKRFLFSSDDVIAVSEGEEEAEDGENDLGNQEDQVPSSDEEDCSDEDRDTEEQSDSVQTNAVFKVTCGDVTATLHQKRFVSGTCGKSIRTETKWLNPVEFVKAALDQPDATWKKDIMVEGRPLNALIEAALDQPDATWKKDIMVEGRPLNALIEEEILKIHSLLCSCRLCHPSDTDLENERNDDECHTCRGEEEQAELVQCDDCPRSFHQKCHLPHVDDATLSDSRPWECTFCVLQKAQEWRYNDEMEMNAVMSRHISGHMLECQYLLLFLRNADEKQDFVSNPCAYLENYSSVIQTPMWLDKVADKLQENEYNTVGEFVSDMQLIFTNCASYNHNNPEFLDLGDQLKETFNVEFKKVFNICEQH